MKLRIFGAITGIVLSLAGFAVYSAEAKNSEKERNNEDKPSLEVHITDNGKVLVRGAKVTSVTGNKITAFATWGSTVLSWTIVSSTSTEYVRRNGGASNISEIAVGDTISFHGILDTSIGSPITVNAKTVKDWSDFRKHVSMKGVVASANATLKTFILGTENKGDVSVKVTDTTRIKGGNGLGLFSDILIGAKVKVSGIFDSAINVMSAESIRLRK